jgi:hypothetical protein
MIRRKQRKARNARRRKYNDRISVVSMLADKFNMRILAVNGDLRNLIIYKDDNYYNNGYNNSSWSFIGSNCSVIIEGCLPKLEQYLDRYWRMKAFL